MGFRSRKIGTEFLLLQRRRRQRSCLDRLRRDALISARRRSRTRSRLRAIWLQLIVSLLLSRSHPKTFTPALKRNSHAQHRNPTPHAAFDPRDPQGTSWAQGLSRAPFGRRNSSEATRRLARVVRDSCNYRARPADDPLQPDRQVRRRLF